MEHHKISKLFDNSALLKFVTRKWIEVNDLSGSQQFCSKKQKKEDKNNRESKT